MASAFRATGALLLRRRLIINSVTNKSAARSFTTSSNAPSFNPTSSSSNSCFSAVNGASVLAAAVALGSWAAISSTAESSAPNADSSSDLTHESYRPKRELAYASSPPFSKTDEYKYVVFGTGTAALAAIAAIRQNDVTADILLVTDPNERVSGRRKRADLEDISPELSNVYNEWRRHISSRLDSELNNNAGSSNVTVLVGHPEMRLDVENRCVVLPEGVTVRYKTCLLATPGKPRDFYVLDPTKISYSLKDEVNTLKDIKDFERLHKVMKEPQKHVTVVGGGFLGTEITAALAASGTRVTQVYAEAEPLMRYLPKYLSEHIASRLHDSGVELKPDRLVTGVKRPAKSQVRVGLMGWEKEYVDTDYVVLASTHVDPKVDLAERSGLEIDSSNGGVIVNSGLEAFNGVFVAGSAASYFDSILGRRRVEMYDHAVNSGMCAGRNMVTCARGKMTRYEHQPMIHCNLVGTGFVFEGIGEIDSSLKTVGVWVTRTKSSSASTTAAQIANSPYTRGIVYYIRENRVVGILCCNSTPCLERAREVLREKREINNPVRDLKSRILLGPDQWLNVVVTSEA